MEFQNKDREGRHAVSTHDMSKEIRIPEEFESGGASYTARVTHVGERISLLIRPGEGDSVIAVFAESEQALILLLEAACVLVKQEHDHNQPKTNS